MTTTSPAIVRLLLATTVLSVAALGVGLFGVLRVPDRPPAVIPEELTALRSELAELRRSVELTRSQLGAPGNSVAIADAERRLARLEASVRAGARPAGAVASADGSTPSADASADPPAAMMADGTPRYTSLVPPNSSVKVEQLPGGALAVTNRDPKLAGQSMVIKGRTADGRDTEVSVTVPPPG